MDTTMLDSVFDDAVISYPSGLSADDLFEFFCADKLLTNYDVSYAEISDGIIDGKGDGGLDSAYLFIDRRLVASDFDYNSVGEEPEVELILIQSKNTSSFSEVPVDKLTSLINAFVFNTPSPTTLAAFKPEVAAVFANFKSTLSKVGKKFPTVAIHAFYCARAGFPATSIVGKADALQNTLAAQYPNSTVSLVGATRLYELAREQKTFTKALPAAVPPLNVQNALVGLVKLSDFAAFITDGQGGVINRIFESNVRDYQGDIEVNREIAASLQPGVTTEFWWLNNGVTIVADKARYEHPNINIRNPLIVNGLQTSFEIHSQAASLETDTRNVLVKIIEVTDQAEREKIIRATNRQTAIQSSSFRATDDIHVKIDDYLKGQGYYYDRRKNSYKRQGKPADRIIGIDRMAQAVLSVLLQKPEIARARPGTALKKEADYKAIFTEDAAHPMQMYHVTTVLLMQVEAYFRSIRKTTDRALINNMKFHVLMVLAWTLNANSTLPGQRVAQLDPTKVDDAMLHKVAAWVFGEFTAFGATDAKARDPKFTKRLKDNWTSAATA